MNAATVIAVLIGGLFFVFVWTWAAGRRYGALRDIPAALMLFAAAMAGSAGAGWLAYRWDIFQPGHPAAQVFTTGALLAGILTLVRVRKIVPALILSMAWVLFQAASALGSGSVGFSIHAAWALIMAVGVLIIAGMWELMEAGGVRLGKFLLAGPLLGGVYTAAAPVSFLTVISPNSAMYSLLMTFALGVVIGDGVGFGVELVDLFRARAGHAGGPRPAG